jgi:hypothetical protein
MIRDRPANRTERLALFRMVSRPWQAHESDHLSSSDASLRPASGRDEARALDLVAMAPTHVRRPRSRKPDRAWAPSFDWLPSDRNRTGTTRLVVLKPPTRVEESLGRAPANPPTAIIHLRDATIHVPPGVAAAAIFSSPGDVVQPDRFGTIDIVPTVLGWAPFPPPRRMSGVHLDGTVQGNRSVLPPIRGARAAADTSPTFFTSEARLAEQGIGHGAARSTACVHHPRKWNPRPEAPSSKIPTCAPTRHELA